MLKNITAELVSATIKPRDKESHKGTYGKVLLIGGNAQFGGAIIMAAEACLNAGAGLVTVATDSTNNAALHTRIPEAMFIDYTDKETISKTLKSVDVVVIGPGLGTTDFAREIVQTTLSNLSASQTCVIDASALTILSKQHELLDSCSAKIILTPHQMEWQKLSGIEIADQSDSANLVALKKLCRNATLVLKSSATKIYDQSDIVWQNTLGNPGMATGGTGDTLTGIIAGIVAQFGSTTASINTAVFLHSYAGDQIAETNYVVLPTKISALLPKIMHTFASKNA